VSDPGSATTDAQRALIQRFYSEVWDRGNVDVALNIFHDDYIRHDLRPSEAPPGGAGQAKIAADFRKAFPDLRFNVELMIAEGDFVAARWTATGTHMGRWGSVPPSGRSVRFSGVNIFRLRDGKVAEIWNHRDDLGLMSQIGLPVFAGAIPVDQGD
jgi:steroid delta-isomerase-like uncharacterized protein